MRKRNCRTCLCRASHPGLDPLSDNSIRVHTPLQKGRALLRTEDTQRAHTLHLVSPSRESSAKGHAHKGQVPSCSLRYTWAETTEARTHLEGPLAHVGTNR